MTTLAWAYRIYVDGMYVEIAKCWPMAWAAFIPIRWRRLRKLGAMSAFRG